METAILSGYIRVLRCESLAFSVFIGFKVQGLRFEA